MSTYKVGRIYSQSRGRGPRKCFWRPKCVSPRNKNPGGATANRVDEWQVGLEGVANSGGCSPLKNIVFTEQILLQNDF